MENYEMFSEEGNQACQALVDKATAFIKSDKKVTPPELRKMISDGMKEIEKDHSEVWDSEPPYHICRILNDVLGQEGYQPILDEYDLD